MQFIAGFLVWAAIGVIAGLVIRAVYKADHTVAALTVILGLFGAFIGGMLGVSGYVHHDPVPLRPGGLIGAVAGALVATFLYHFMARKAV